MTTPRQYIFGSLTIGLLLGLAGGAQAGSACDIGDINSAAKLQATLQERAIEVVTLAAKGGAKDLKRLEVLVSPSANFDLGAGDLGRGLGTGVAGARALAVAMNANLYIVSGWDYMDMAVEAPCAEQKAGVEFLNNRVKSRSFVTFTFVNGRVSEAQGWEGSYGTGSIPLPKGN
jgi:hypothetical protein